MFGPRNGEIGSIRTVAFASLFCRDRHVGDFIVLLSEWNGWLVGA